MVDTVDILNRYRLSLAEDSQAVSILAVLFKTGPQSENELSEATKTPRRELVPKVRQLFQAKLLRHTGSSPRWWVTTPLADEVLTGLGIAEIAATSLLDEEAVPQLEKSLIHAFMSAKHWRDMSSARHLTCTLRTIRELEKDASTPGRAATEARTRLIFAAVIGADPDAQQFSGTELCQSVLSWHERNATPLWKEHRLDWTTHSRRLSRRCESALELASESNSVLLAPEAHFGTKKEGEALRLTFVRIVSSLAASVADPGIEAARWLNNDAPDKVWMLLSDAVPQAQKRATELLKLWGAPTVLGSSDHVRRVEAELRRLSSSRPDSLALRGYGASGGQEQFRLYETLLSKLKTSIDAGAYDENAKRRVTLAKLLIQATGALARRVSDPVQKAARPRSRG